MNIERASRDVGLYAADHDHRGERVACVDESDFTARAVQAGLRRAEDEQRYAASLLQDREQKDLPSEVFFG